jgi:hypothetical protein
MAATQHPSIAAGHTSRPMNRWLALAVLSAGCLLVPAGCGKTSTHPATYRATGQVLLDAQPVAGAEVSFEPAAGHNARPAHALTDSQGRFSLHTYFGPGDDVNGAIPNDYRVGIRKIPPAQGIVNLEAGARPPANELPEKYANPATSGLPRTVSADKPNDFVFELAR